MSPGHTAIAGPGGSGTLISPSRSSPSHLANRSWLLAFGPIAFGPIAFGPLAFGPVAFAFRPIAFGPVAFAFGPIAFGPIAFGPLASGFADSPGSMFGFL